MAENTGKLENNPSKVATCSAIEGALVTFTRLLREQLFVSDQLEKIADCLPDHVDAITCAKLQDQLPGLVEVCWQIDRDVIFPVLLRPNGGPYVSPTTVERWCDERLSDQGFALEICDLLKDLSVNMSTATANEAGYMLRGFFDNLRRAAAFELEHLIPLAQPRLTANDLAEMTRLLSQHRTIVSLACLSTREAITNHLPQ